MSQPTAPALGSSPPDSPSESSSSSTPSFRTQHPTLHAATTDYRGGHRSFLNVIFDARLNYDDVRTLILQGLTTADFDNLRQTSRSIDHCLMMPSAAGGLRHPPDLIDNCHEFGLPAPPSLPPRGSCPNPPQSTVRIRACQYYNYIELRFHDPHQNVTTHPREHLVCEVCRRNWHDNIGNNPGWLVPNQMSRHDLWRLAIARAHITVCSLCDLEQKRQHYPEGYDGCLCYRNYYQKRWLCQRCDIQNGLNLGRDISFFTGQRRNLRQVGDRIAVMPRAQGPPDLPRFLSWCPCGRKESEPAPRAMQSVPTPWPGNQNLVRSALNHDTGRRTQTTKQCVLCCGYIVPRAAMVRQPVRRSARLADRRSGTQNERRHTMLGRSGKAATRHGVNGKGFEVRGRGGWN